jgi:hypothetical protein
MGPFPFLRGRFSDKLGRFQGDVRDFHKTEVRLKLGTEGYGPTVMEKGIRQASKASSFVEASEDMREQTRADDAGRGV